MVAAARGLPGGAGLPARDHAGYRVGHAVRQVHAGVAKAVTREGGGQQHGGARRAVARVAHRPHQVLRHQLDGALGPQIADRIGALVGGPQRRLRRRLARRVGQRGERLDGVAEYVQPGAGRHRRRQGPGVVRVDDAQHRPQRAMGDPGLGAHRQVVEYRHAGGFAAGAGGSGHRHQRLERSRHRLAAANRLIDVGQQLRRVGGVEIGGLRGVDAGTASHRGEPVAAALPGGADCFPERGVAGLDSRFRVADGVDAGAAQRLARHRHRLQLRQYRVGDQQRAAHAQGAQLEAQLARGAGPELDARPFHVDDRLGCHARAQYAGT